MASARGGCGAARTRHTNAEGAVGRPGAGPARRRRRGAHGPRPAARLGRPPRAKPADRLTLGEFARLPLELLVVVAVAAPLPATPRRVLAVSAGAVLSVLVLVKVLDIGFFTAFDRPFEPIDDSSHVGIGIETLRDAIGRSSADLRRRCRGRAHCRAPHPPGPGAAARDAGRGRASRLGAPAAAALGVLWVALRVVGAPVASSSAAALAVDEVQAVRAGLADRSVLAREIARDRFHATPGNRLPTGPGQGRPARVRRELRRVGVQDSSFSPRIGATLERGAAQLRAAGLLSRSAFLYLADLRRPQLAGAFHPAVRGPGRRPAA